MKRVVNLIVAGAILLALLGYMITYTVPFNEAAIVTTFGRADDGSVINAPGADGLPGQDAGLHFKWPWPISQVARRYDTRLQVLENTSEQHQLRDTQTIVINTYVAWRISDPLKFYKKVSTRAAAVDAINLSLQNARGQVGQYTFDELTNPDPTKLRLGELEEKMLQQIETQVADLDLGITIEDVGVKRLMLPEMVTQVVTERMRSERQRLAAQAAAEGDADQRALVQQAENQRDLILTFADRTASSISAEGRQRAGEIMARFAQDEEFAIYLLQLQTLQETLSRKTTFIIDTSMPPFDLLRGIPQAQSIAPAQRTADADEKPQN
jgi:membrane protease subunit HflC